MVTLDVCILIIGPTIVGILAFTGTFAAVSSGNDSSTSSAAETASRLARRALSGGDYAQLEDTFKAVGVVAYVGILICYAAAVGLPLWLVLRSNPSSEAAYSSNSLGIPFPPPPGSKGWALERGGGVDGVFVLFRRGGRGEKAAPPTRGRKKKRGR
ncbi:hypothetical protein JCM8097_007103 [Rhodosporidiobolus ruineniae]